MLPGIKFPVVGYFFLSLWHFDRGFHQIIFSLVFFFFACTSCNLKIFFFFHLMRPQFLLGLFLSCWKRTGKWAEMFCLKKEGTPWLCDTGWQRSMVCSQGEGGGSVGGNSYVTDWGSESHLCETQAHGSTSTEAKPGLQCGNCVS